MGVRFTGSGRQLSEDEIELLEDELERKLPNAYREFLLADNGGRPTPSMFSIPALPDRPLHDSSMHSFFGLFMADPSEELRYVAEEYAAVLPSPLLPIGRDYGDNVVCLATIGTDEGSLYLWESEFYEPALPPEDQTNLIWVAPSFEEFLNGFFDYDESSS